MIRKDLIELLQELSTDQSPHSGRTLMQHLQGTHRLLEEWGNPEAVCNAGLFHSIYGTEFYRTRSADLAQREQIRKHIGQGAEELAYLFGACDRRHAFSNVERGGGYSVKDLFRGGEEVPIPESTLRALLEIEAANFLDQAGPVEELSAEPRERWLARWRKAQPFLSPAAYRSLLDYFRAT
jgi:hypothetical protein